MHTSVSATPDWRAQTDPHPRLDTYLLIDTYPPRGRSVGGRRPQQRTCTVFLHSCRLICYPPLDKNETALHCQEGRFCRLLHEKRGLLRSLSGDDKGGQHRRKTVLYSTVYSRPALGGVVRLGPARRLRLWRRHPIILGTTSATRGFPTSWPARGCAAPLPWAVPCERPPPSRSARCDTPRHPPFLRHCPPFNGGRMTPGRDGAALSLSLRPPPVYAAVPCTSDCIKGERGAQGVRRCSGQDSKRQPL